MIHPGQPGLAPLPRICHLGRMPEPLRIAGAGPSGLACAIALAQRGHAVELHEARPVVGGRFDGDHQVLPDFGEGPRGRELLAPLGLDAARHDLWLRPLTRARFLGPRGEHAGFASEQPYSWLLRRGPGAGTLDRALANRAEELGVPVHTRSRLADGEADFLATGPQATDGLAIERLFECDHDGPPRADVLFDPELAPRGYAYLFCAEGEGTVGIAALEGYTQLGERLDDCIERFQRLEPFAMRRARSAANAMAFALPQSAVQAGRRLVGERGGFQDYLFGLGLRMALLSGQLAARAHDEGADYDALWQRELGPRMRRSAVERLLYEKGAATALRLLPALRGRDLREQLDRAHAPGRVKDWLGGALEGRFLAHRDGVDRAGGCGHDLGPHWCRPSPARVHRGSA